MSSKTHYETLGVARTATPDELSEAFKELARQHHPDAQVGKKRKSKVSFADISAAYAVLKDPKKRAAYDGELALLNKPCPKCAGKGQTYRSKGFTGRIAVMCTDCNGSGFAAK